MIMDPNTTVADGAVVVAIDESSSSRAALAWAADYARDVHADLHAVHVLRYDFGAPVTWAPGLLGSPHTVSQSVFELAKLSMRQLFDSVLAEPSWKLTFLEGPAGQEIVQYARNAQLLVIGTREHRGMERLLVGSVSHYCLSHAECPIVAVPATKASLVVGPPADSAAGVPNGARS
jgi:nucleotide-binding universal stress UspA family protein